MPKDELWQLYCAAYEQYQSEIINGEKSYSRYVNNFYYYHLPAMNMSESDARVHIMNVCGLKELLENRRDLVDAFFKKTLAGWVFLLNFTQKRGYGIRNRQEGTLHTDSHI